MAVENKLFMANHPWPHRLGVAVHRLEKRYLGTAVVCIDSVAGLLDKFGVPVIPVKANPKASPYASVSGKMKITLLEMIGGFMGLPDRALQGDQVVEAICGFLDEGANVFICPAGVSGRRMPWRSGIGRVVREIDSDKVGAGFVFIPNSPMRNEKYVLHPTIGSLLPNIQDTDTVQEIAAQLQKQYEKTFNVF